MNKKETTRSLKVPFRDIPEEGLHLVLPLAVEWLADLGHEGLRFLHRAQMDVLLEPAGRDVRVSGSVSGDAEMTCVRCLTAFRCAFEPHFSVMMFPEETESVSKEKELKKEHLETDLFRDGVVDIERLLVDQIVLSLPSYPRCSDDCRGLCPTCGTNLNVGACRCQTQAPERVPQGGAFSALEGLKILTRKRGG